jgi:signal transduction histidine kinase
VSGYVLNIRDATDRRRLEEERRERELAQEREATQRSEIERLHESLEAEREKHELQQQLQRAQRLEAVGQVAGGVAHDFNNLLMIINNYVTLVRDELPEGSQGREDIDEIGRAAERGGRLTRQLLAFARRKPGEPEVLDVDEVITGMSQLLDRPLGRHVALGYEPQPDLWPIELDRADLEQIVLNLVINSRDALEGEDGHITVSVGNLEVDEERATDLVVVPGRYVRVAVTDDGCGIDAETIHRVWEPFFTTKGAIEGSGLGLATVHGIAHQAGGGTAIASTPGEGTTVEVYLPASGHRVNTVADGTRPPSASVDQPRIMLVEVDAALRHAMRRVLESAGHEVRDAGGSEEALSVLSADPDCDLLLTNLIMPRMWGDELAARVREIVPDAAVLYIAGHGDRFLEGSRAAAAKPVLTKPFSDDALLNQVADLLVVNRPSDGVNPQPAVAVAEA